MMTTAQSGEFEPSHVVVAGGAGFIGSAFARNYLAWHPEARVTVLDKLTYAGNLRNLDPVRDDPRFRFVQADIAGYDAVAPVVAQADTVVNFAAESVAAGTYLPVHHGHGIKLYTAEELFTTYTQKRGSTTDPRGVEIVEPRLPLFALSFRNGMGQWRRITHITRHRYTGRVVTLRQKWGSVTVTPNHSVYDADARLVAAETNPELLAIRKINVDRSRHRHHLKLCLPGITATEGRLYAPTADGRRRSRDVYVDQTLQGKELTAFTRFVGAFVAEGNTLYNPAAGSWQVCISNCDLGFLEQCLRDAALFTNAAGFITRREAPHASQLTFNCHILHLLLTALCGARSYDKRVPEAFYTLGDEYKRAFLDSYLRGDGNVQRYKTIDTRRLTTTSSRLAAGIGLLLSLMGADYSVSYREFEENRVWRPAHSLNLVSSYDARTERGFEESDYDGYVYDLTVDGTHNFAAGIGNIVVHNTHVDRSILDPDVFVHTNLLGLNTLLRAARGAGVKRFLQVSCYDAESRVLTRRGLRRYDEVRVGDGVLTINLETRQIEEKAVEKVIVQDYNGPMIAFRSNRIDLLVTPNHRMLYCHRQDPTTKIHVDEASAVAKKTACFLPRGRWKGDDQDHVRCGGLGTLPTEDLFYLVGVFLGDGFLGTQRQRRPNKTGLTRGEFLRRARSRDGRFKAIGKLGDRDETELTCHRIFFDVPQHDKARARLQQTLTRLGIAWKAHAGRAGEHIYFSSKAWSDFLSKCGTGAGNKRVPQWMLEYGPRYLRALLDGVVDSDGYRHLGNKQPRISTCSFGMVCDLMEVGFKLGLMPRFSELKYRETTLRSGRVIRPRRPHYMVFFRDEGIGISKQNASTQQYSGKVWCLKVQDNRNLIVERNGILTFCGNTDEIYGHVGEGASTEDAPLKPRNPYSASKAGGDLLAFSYQTNFGLPVLVTRGANTIGPYQYPEKATPLFITNALEDLPLPVYGEGKALRHYLYVDDHAAAIDLVLRRGIPGEAYNVGALDEVNTVQLATRILDLLGKPHTLIRFVPDRPAHDYRYRLDSAKLEQLGWRRRYDWDATIAATVDWYAQHQDWWRPLKSEEFRRVREHIEDAHRAAQGGSGGLSPAAGR